MVAGFVVDPQWRVGPSLDGLPVHAWGDAALPEKTEWTVGIGYRNMRTRVAVARRLDHRGAELATIVSPAASLAGSAVVGSGAIIFPGCVVEHGVMLGSNTTLWSGSIVCHDTVIGSDGYFAPSTAISGNCRIGNGCFFGTRATVIDGIEIGNDCRVDAGSLVVADAAPAGHYRGSPARRIATIGRDGIEIAR